MTDAILAVLILLPVVLTFILKGNAGQAYLAVCAGYVMESLAGGDIDNFLEKNNLHLGTSDIALAIFIAPLLLTIFFSSRSWKGQTKMVLHLVAAALAGLLLAIISVPFLGSVVDLDLFHSKIWPLLQHARGAVIIGGTIYCLLVVWFSKTTHPEKSKKHKGH